MTNLAQFLTARLAEDQRDAQYCHMASCGAVAEYAGACDCGLPARVLADLAAKRKLIDEIFYYESETDDACFHTADSIRAGKCPVKPVGKIDALRLLAAPYADHPDYDQAWAVND